MNLRFAGLLLVFGLQYLSSAPPAKVPHVIGGKEVGRGRWPWLLSIQEDNLALWDHICGATLITTSQALTAAHCMPDLEDRHRVQIGCSDVGAIDDCEETIDITKLVLHPDFEELLTGNENDIALFSIARPARLNNYVRVAQLAKATDVFKNMNCILAGWGELDNDGDETSDLHEVSMPIIPNKQCEAIFDREQDMTVHSNQLCFFNNRTAACEGDFGGPVNCQLGSSTYFVAGVMSWSLDDCGKRYPTVATSVPSFRGWIDTTLRNLTAI